MSHDLPERPKRHAFTLVEMLTVVIIIGILAGMMLVAFGAARTRARAATIKMEITQLQIALERYKMEYGDYPPDFVGCNHNINTPNDPIRIFARQAVLRHLRKRFPRYNIPNGTPDQQFEWFVYQVYNATGLVIGTVNNFDVGTVVGNVKLPALETRSMNTSQAMVFWLGGLPSTYASTELTQFSANPSNPIENATDAPRRTSVIYEFDRRKLLLYRAATQDWTNSPTDPAIDASTAPAYGVASSGGVMVPFAYFYPIGTPYTGSGGNLQESIYLQAIFASSSNLRAAPYADSTTYDVPPPQTPLVLRLANLRWINSGKPQIISAGLDGGFGSINNTDLLHPHVPYLFPSGLNLVADSMGGVHDDNITNFTDGGTVGDDIKAQQ